MAPPREVRGAAGSGGAGPGGVGPGGSGPGGAGPGAAVARKRLGAAAGPRFKSYLSHMWPCAPRLSCEPTPTRKILGLPSNMND